MPEEQENEEQKDLRNEQSHEYVELTDGRQIITPRLSEEISDSLNGGRSISGKKRKRRGRKKKNEFDIMRPDDKEYMNNEYEKAEERVEDYQTDKEKRRNEYVISKYDRFFEDNDIDARTILDASKFSEQELQSIGDIQALLTGEYSQAGLLQLYSSINLAERLPRKMRSVFEVLLETKDISEEWSSLLQSKLQLIEKEYFSDLNTLQLPKYIRKDIEQVIQGGCIETSYVDMVKKLFEKYDVYNYKEESDLSFHQRWYLRMIVQLLPWEDKIVESLQDMEKLTLKPTTAEVLHGEFAINANEIDDYRNNPLLQFDVHSKLEILFILSNINEDYDKIASERIKEYFGLLVRKFPDLSKEENVYILLENLPNWSSMSKRSKEVEGFVNTINAMKEVFDEKKKQHWIRYKKSHPSIKTKSLDHKMDALERKKKEYAEKYTALKYATSTREMKESYNENHERMIQIYDKMKKIEREIGKMEREIGKISQSNPKFQMSLKVMRTLEEQKDVDEVDKKIKSIITFFETLQANVETKEFADSTVLAIGSVGKESVNNDDIVALPEFQWFSHIKNKRVENLYHIVNEGVNQPFEYEQIYRIMDTIFDSISFSGSFCDQLEQVEDDDQKTKYFDLIERVISNIVSVVDEHSDPIGSTKIMSDYISEKYSMSKKIEGKEDIREVIIRQCAENNDTDIFDRTGFKSNLEISDIHYIANICLEKGHKEFLYELIKHGYKRYKNEKLIVGLFSDEWIDFLEEYFIGSDKNSSGAIDLYSKITISKNTISDLQGHPAGGNEKDLQNNFELKKLDTFFIRISKNNISKKTASSILTFFIPFNLDLKFGFTVDLTSIPNRKIERSMSPYMHIAVGGNVNLLNAITDEILGDSLQESFTIFQKNKIGPVNGSIGSQGIRKGSSLVHIIASTEQQDNISELMHCMEELIEKIDPKRIFDKSDADSLAFLTSKRYGYYDQEKLSLENIPNDIKIFYLLTYNYEKLSGLQLLAAKGHIDLVESYLQLYAIDIWYNSIPSKVMNSILSVEGITQQGRDWFLSQERKIDVGI